MLENIKALSLEEKKTLLAMLLADIKAYNAFIASFEPEKPLSLSHYYWILETRRCAEIAEIKRSGGSVISSRPDLLENE